LAQPEKCSSDAELRPKAAPKCKMKWKVKQPSSLLKDVPVDESIDGDLRDRWHMHLRTSDDPEAEAARLVKMLGSLRKLRFAWTAEDAKLMVSGVAPNQFPIAISSNSKVVGAMHCIGGLPEGEQAFDDVWPGFSDLSAKEISPHGALGPSPEISTSPDSDAMLTLLEDLKHESPSASGLAFLCEDRDRESTFGQAPKSEVQRAGAVTAAVNGERTKKSTNKIRHNYGPPDAA